MDRSLKIVKALPPKNQRIDNNESEIKDKT